MKQSARAKKAVPRRRSAAEAARHARLRFSATMIAVIIGALTVGGTVAWIVDDTDALINTFEPAVVSTIIDESFDGNMKKDVRVQNTGDVSAYIRAAVVVNWVDSSGNVTARVPEGYLYTPGGSIPATPGWKEFGGFYYYADPVSAGDFTTNLIDSIEPTSPSDPQYFLSVEILTEAIQANPASAVEDAWGVTVSDGKISLEELSADG